MPKSQIAEFTDYITPDGLVYNFDDACKFLVSQTGMGMAPVKYISQQGPLQHGETVYDYRLKKRIIQIIYREDNDSRAAYWTARDDLLNYIRPNRQLLGTFNTGALRKRLPNNTMRQIDVFIEKGPIFVPTSPGFWDEWGIEETLRFIAHDPTFYDPVLKTAIWALVSIDELVFPFDFKVGADGTGLLFDSGVIDSNIDITYPGTWHTYPTITITGPLIGFTIENSSIGERIKLDSIIAVGEVVTINLEFGNKLVTSSIHGNLYGQITSDSDLATFRIVPEPEVVDGINTINVTGGGALIGTTAVTVSYYTRYIGI